jgi:DNA-binding NarL/FixJ family response regulator
VKSLTARWRKTATSWSVASSMAARLDGATRSSGVAARRVGVVAGDEPTRERVVQLLLGAGFELAFQSCDPASAPKGVPAERGIDVLVLVDGQRAFFGHEVRALRAEFSESALIAVVGSDGRRAAVRRAMGWGAGAFVTLDRLDEALIPSLGAALTGQLVVPGGRARQPDSQALSVRERQVLALVVMGMTNAEIAAKLFLAESTVKSHLSSAFTKLGVGSRNEATAMILDPDSGVGAGIRTSPER